VFHDQDIDITGQLQRYEQVLKTCQLSDIPFHMTPLMRGYENYRNLDFKTRQVLMSKFLTMAQHLPFSYKTLAYRKSEFTNSENLLLRMKRDFTTMLFDNLEYFQSFEKVKVITMTGSGALPRLSIAASSTCSQKKLTCSKTRGRGIPAFPSCGFCLWHRADGNKV